MSLAKLFRLGNLVETWMGFYDGAGHYSEPTISTKEVGIKDLELMLNPGATYRGIVVTARWLTKMGFVDQHADYCECFKSENAMVTFIPDGTIEVRIDHYNLIAVDTKIFFFSHLYVHELQNLYFSLMGKELQINPL